MKYNFSALILSLALMSIFSLKAHGNCEDEMETVVPVKNELAGFLLMFPKAREVIGAGKLKNAQVIRAQGMRTGHFRIVLTEGGSLYIFDEHTKNVASFLGGYLQLSDGRWLSPLSGGDGTQFQWQLDPHVLPRLYSHLTASEAKTKLPSGELLRSEFILDFQDALARYMGNESTQLNADTLMQSQVLAAKTQSDRDIVVLKRPDQSDLFFDVLTKHEVFLRPGEIK